MDWDDEDEKTTIFERGNDDAARALLRSGPPPQLRTPPPPNYANSPTTPPARPAQHARTPSAPPYGVPRTTGNRPLPYPTPPATASPFTEPRSGGGRSVLLAIVTLLVVGLVAASVILFWPKTGNLVVTVSGPNNKPIDALQVLLNGKERCHTSPCRLSGLDTGTHLVRVVAPGYQQTADQAVKVSASEDAVLNLALAPSGEGTGLKVSAEGSGLVLSVDGRELGALPAEVKDLSPGEHTVRIIDKSGRYQTFEKPVTVEPDKLVKLEPKLKVAKGLAVIRAGENANDARVLLVSGNERRPIPTLPIKIDIATDKSYSLVASKKGFDDFKQDITFEDGQAEKTFLISLTPAAESTHEPERAPEPVTEKASARPAPVAAAPARPRSAPSRRTSSSSNSDDDETPAPGGGDSIANGTLNISSTPPATVVLDGKPLGTTPKTVNVAPGPHTLLFVHPDFGRKSRSITVQAGKPASASVNFP